MKRSPVWARMNCHQRLRVVAATAVCAVGFMLAASATPAGAVVPVATSPAGDPHALPLQISDSFNGTGVNPAVWYNDAPYAGTSVGVQNGSLVLTASSAPASGFHDGITTRCQAVGDFDAIMSFSLTTWPARDNVSLAVNTIIANTFVNSQVGGDVTGLFVNQPTAYVQIPVSVRSGDLRLSRRGDLVSAYIRPAHGGRWLRSGQFIGLTSPTFVDLAIWDTSGPFGGQPVSVQVGSFELYAAGLAC